MIRNKCTILFLVVAFCGVVLAIQPGCRTRYEMRTKWTVQDTSSRFWQCKRWGLAVQTSCPPGTLFSQPYQTCVPAKVWEEFPYYPPPSSATEDVDECQDDGDECLNICIDVPCEGGIIIDQKCVCSEQGWGLIGGICRNPEVVCVGGEIYDDKCNCAQGLELIDGTCTDPSEPVICAQGVTDPCVCPTGFSADIKGICVDDISSCEGGEWYNGRCYCPGDSVLINGICTTQPGNTEGCANGEWNPIEGFCACNEGFRMVEGQCVAGQSVGICDGAPDSAYEVKGTWNCDMPDCTREEYWVNFHFPTRNPRTFWQCEEIDFIATEMPCAPGTCFSPDQQTCVHASDWVNPCM